MVIYSNNKGESVEDAIVIDGVTHHFEGVRAEYQYLSDKFGRRGIDWDLEKQAVFHKNDRYYDQLSIKLADGTKKVFFFDVTAFFGKGLSR